MKKELKDIETRIPNKQIVVEYKTAEYVVYKNPDLTYGISISKNLGAGMDIYHQLTEEEKVNYLRDGIKALSERMKDMDMNYNNYKVTSWR